MTITLLDTGTLMIHHQTNVYDYFTFQHFAQSPPLLKQIWDANKESLSDFIYLSNSQEKKKSKIESKYVAKCNLMQWNCFEYSNGYLLKTS